MKFTKALICGAIGMISLGTSAALAANSNTKNVEAASQSTFRVWFYRYNDYANYGDEWKIWDGKDGTPAYTPEYVTHDGLTLLYFDLPTTIETIYFQAFSGGNYKIGASVINYTPGMNSHVWYPYNDNGSWSIITTGISSEFQFKLWHLQDVFSSYLSCSSSKDNGYGDFDTLYKTWIFDGTHVKVNGYSESSLLDALDGLNLNENDYSWSDDGGLITYDYTNPSTKTETVSVGSKIKEMKKNYENSLMNGSKFDSAVSTVNNNTPIVITLAVVGISAVAGTFFLLRRKENN